jgi:hypothetical protein
MSWAPTTAPQALILTYRMATVAFIPGWSEGSWHNKVLEEKLTQEGIRKNQNLKEADIIFCHSTGCYLVPENARAKLIVLVGLPYWPNRSLIYSGIIKLGEDFKNTKKDMGILWLIKKTIHNFWYMLKYPRDTLLVATKHEVKNLPDVSKHKVVLIRNHDDTFCHPNINKILGKAKDYEFIELPAGHDDCWTGKQIYVDLIKKSLSN